MPQCDVLLKFDLLVHKLVLNCYKTKTMIRPGEERMRKRVRRRLARRGEEDDCQASLSQIHLFLKKIRPMNGPTEGQMDQLTNGSTDGRTKALIEMRGRI